MFYNNGQPFMYYYNIDNKNHGPHTLAELHHFYHEGSIKADTAVWCQEFGNEWQKLSLLFGQMQAQGMNVELGAETGSLSSEMRKKMSVFGVIALAFKGMKANFGKIVLFGLLPFAVSYALSIVLGILMQILMVFTVAPVAAPRSTGGPAGAAAASPGQVEQMLLQQLLEPKAIIFIAVFVFINLLSSVVSHLSLLGSMRAILAHISGSYTKVSDCFSVFKKPWPYLVNSVSCLPFIIFNMLFMFTLLWLPLHLSDYSLLVDFPNNISQDDFVTFWLRSMLGSLVCMLLTASAFICNTLLCAQSNEVRPREIFFQTLRLAYTNYPGWLVLLIFCGIINLVAAMLFMLPLAISYPFSIFVMAMYFSYCQLQRELQQKSAGGQSIRSAQSWQQQP